MVHDAWGIVSITWEGWGRNGGGGGDIKPWTKIRETIKNIILKIFLSAEIGTLISLSTDSQRNVLESKRELNAKCC